MSASKQSVSASDAARVAAPAGVALAPSTSLARLLGNASFGRFVQAKLNVSEPSDAFELEADRVADQVMRIADPDLRSSVRDAPRIQRMCQSCEEDLPRAAESATAPTVDAATEHSIASLSSGGSALPASVRSYMEPRFQADFGAVRVHTDAHADDLARTMQAKAFTVGNHIVFGAGHYAPDSESGKRLLAHELTHVVQQGSAGPMDSNVVQRDFDSSRLQSPLDPLEDRRQSLDAGWYIEMDPATPVVTAGSEVTFHLLNDQGYGFRDWEEEIPNAGKRPVFVVIDTEHHMTFRHTTNIKPYHAVAKLTLNKPGRYRAAFFGHPKQATHDGSARTLGAEVRVSVDFNVVADLAFETLDGKDVAATSARDREHLESAEATDGERFAAFERLAVREAFKVLEENRKEAEEQLELYSHGTSGTSATKALDDLQKVVDVDDELQAAYYRLVHDAYWFQYKLIPRAKERGIDPIVLQKEEMKRVEELRSGLMQAFPALGLVGRRGDQNPHQLSSSDNELQYEFRHAPAERTSALQSGLRQVLADIDKAKRQLATGELSILKAAPILSATRKALGIDANPNLSHAIDRQLKQHGGADWKTDAAFGAAQILLLFVPGIGPYLAAGLGIVVAARSWQSAATLEAGAGAGVRGGIVATHDLEAQQFWAVIDTAFVALDLGTAALKTLHAAKSVLPHVPEATARITERSAETAGESASRAAESTSGKQAAATGAPPNSALPEAAPGGRSRKTQSGGHTPGGGGRGGSGGPPGWTPHRGLWSEAPERLFEFLEHERVDNRHVRKIPLNPRSVPPPPDGEFRVGIRRSDIAYDAYNDALDRYVGNEVGVYYDDATGEYRVLVGSKDEIEAPRGDSWRPLIHYHPNKTNGLRYRLPAPHDIDELLRRQVRNYDDGPAREFVEWDFQLRTDGNNVEVIRRRTEYGIDRSHKEPFYIRMQRSDGTFEEPLRFAELEDYQRFWSLFPATPP